MKHFIQLLLPVVLIAASLSCLNAQIPRMFTYQGVVIDGAGHFIPDGNHSVTLKIYDVSTGGSPLFAENQTAVFARGIFNVMIGSTTSIPLTVTFDKGYFLGVSVDGGAE